MMMLLFYFLTLEDNMVQSPFKLPSLSHMIFLVFYLQKNSGMFKWNKLTFMLHRNRENLGSMIPVKMK